MLTATEKFMKTIGNKHEVIYMIAEIMDDPMDILFRDNPERIYRDNRNRPIKVDPFKSEKGTLKYVVPRFVSAISEILSCNEIMVDYEEIEDFVLDCFVFGVEGWNISIPPEILA